MLADDIALFALPCLAQSACTLPFLPFLPLMPLLMLSGACRWGKPCTFTHLCVLQWLLCGGGACLGQGQWVPGGSENHGQIRVQGPPGPSGAGGGCDARHGLPPPPPAPPAGPVR